MIHWAWLILAFYVGAATMMLIGQFMAWRARVPSETGFLIPPIKYKPVDDDTKPDLKRPPWVVTKIDINGITYRGTWIRVEFEEPGQPIDDGPVPDTRIDGVG